MRAPMGFSISPPFFVYPLSSPFVPSSLSLFLPLSFFFYNQAAEKGFHLTEKVSPIKPVPGSSLRRILFVRLCRTRRVCSGRYTIFARPTGLNQFLLLVSVSIYDGEQLNLTRITRNEMGAYLCIATNGVPPTVSKRITVDVECEWISRIYTYRRARVKINERVPTRAFTTRFLKKKKKKSLVVCCLLFLERKKETKDFSSVGDTRFKYEKKKEKKEMRGFCFIEERRNGK